MPLANRRRPAAMATHRSSVPWPPERMANATDAVSVHARSAAVDATLQCLISKAGVFLSFRGPTGSRPGKTAQLLMTKSLPRIGQSRRREDAYGSFFLRHGRGRRLAHAQAQLAPELVRAQLGPAKAQTRAQSHDHEPLGRHRVGQGRSCAALPCGRGREHGHGPAGAHSHSDSCKLQP